MATPSRSRYAWRLVHAPEWAAIQEHGFFEGSAIDHRDGYLHMSPASEVKRSAIIYFAGVTDLWLLKIGAWAWAEGAGRQGMSALR